MIVMYLITQEDTAATLLGSILGVAGVTISLGLALLARYPGDRRDLLRPTR